MTFTGLIGKIFLFPLRAIIGACVALRIHPNILTFVGVLVNAWAAVHLARGEFKTAFLIIASPTSSISSTARWRPRPG